MTEGSAGRRPPRLAVERKIQFGSGAALALLVAVGAAALRSTAGTVESAGWVSHTLEVEGILHDTLRDLIDAQTGGRGFALTGQDAFLEPYDLWRAESRILNCARLSIVFRRSAPGPAVGPACKGALRPTQIVTHRGGHCERTTGRFPQILPQERRMTSG